MTKTAEFVLTSAHNGMSLILSDWHGLGCDGGLDYYSVAVIGSEVNIQTRVYSYLSPDMSVYFQEIAQAWRGWEGKKCWSSLEGEFALMATADRTGHIFLGFQLRSPDQGSGYDWCFSGTLLLEAGSLDGIAKKAKAFWNGTVI